MFYNILCPRPKLHFVAGAVLYYAQLGSQGHLHRPCHGMGSLCHGFVKALLGGKSIKVTVDLCIPGRHRGRWDLKGAIPGFTPADSWGLVSRNSPARNALGETPQLSYWVRSRLDCVSVSTPFLEKVTHLGLLLHNSSVPSDGLCRGEPVWHWLRTMTHGFANRPSSSRGPTEATNPERAASSSTLPEESRRFDKQMELHLQPRAGPCHPG